MNWRLHQDRIAHGGDLKDLNWNHRVTLRHILVGSRDPRHYLRLQGLHSRKLVIFRNPILLHYRAQKLTALIRFLFGYSLSKAIPLNALSCERYSLLGGPLDRLWWI